MKRLLRTTAGAAFGLLLLARTAGAAETPATPDTSLEREIDNYLQEVEGGSEDPTTFRMFWKEGIKGETSDGMFKIAIIGRLMNDWFWISGSDDHDTEVTEDGVFFRRVRLGVEGTVYKNMLFKIQLDFAKGSEVALKDVYMGLQNLPFLGTWKVGHHHEPFSLEELTSSKYITFIERSAPTNAFAPSRHTGTSFSNTVAEDRVMWAIGIFRTTDEEAGGSVRQDGGYAVTFRITGKFLEDKESGRMVHVGFGVSYRAPNDKMHRFRARFGPGTGDRLVDTGTIDAENLLLYNFELAMTWKSFSAALEFFGAEVSNPSGLPEPSFNGWYVEVAYWITGETRSFKNSTWGRTKPRKNFHNDAGPGGWQVAFRYDMLDLTDGGITGGVQDNLTAGVNWHMNPNARVMFNVVFTDLSDGATGSLTSFITRFQFDF